VYCLQYSCPCARMRKRARRLHRTCLKMLWLQSGVKTARASVDHMSKQSEVSQSELCSGLKPMFTMSGHTLAVSSVKYASSVHARSHVQRVCHRHHHYHKSYFPLAPLPSNRPFHRFSPCSRFLLTTSADQTLLLWDASSGKCLRQFVGHTRGVNDVSWGADGSFFASASDDTTVRIWDVEYGRWVGHSTAAHGAECLIRV
jgi:WD40 repeat protein